MCRIGYFISVTVLEPYHKSKPKQKYHSLCLDIRILGNTFFTCSSLTLDVDLLDFLTFFDVIPKTTPNACKQVTPDSASQPGTRVNAS